MGQQILGRKQKISNDAWLKAMEQIEDLVSKQELDEKVRQTVKDIKATTGGKKAAVAWSGGKDSLVLADVCRQAGIEDSVLVVSNLEYKAFTDWVDANKPPKYYEQHLHETYRPGKTGKEYPHPYRATA